MLQLEREKTREVQRDTQREVQRDVQRDVFVNKVEEKNRPTKVQQKVKVQQPLLSAQDAFHTVERQKIVETENPLRKSTISSLLSGQMVYELKKLNIETVEELLWNNAQDIVRRSKHLQLKDVQQVLQDVSSKVSSKPTSVYDMFFGTSKQLKLSIGCQLVDDVLNGGILSKTITEIFGEAGSGKSQLCMQLALQVQLPIEQGGLGGTCLYFNTESDFPIDRLSQISKYYSIKYDKPDLLNGVLIQSAHDLKSLYDILSFRAYSHIKSHLNTPENVKLIIIDSIAGIVRHHYDHSESVERARDLWIFSKKLLQIADEFNIPIVITNQVSDFFSNDPASQDSPHNTVIAALGLSWSNCINSRLFLKKTHEMWDVDQREENSHISKRRKITEEDGDGYPVVAKVPIRELSIVLSSLVSNQKVRFIVTSEGVRGVE